MSMTPREHDAFMCIVNKVCDAGVPAEAVEVILDKAEIHGRTDILGYFQQYCCNEPWPECSKCGVPEYTPGVTPNRPKTKTDIGGCPTCTTGGGGTPGTTPGVPGVVVTPPSDDAPSKFRELACSPIAKIVIKSHPFFIANDGFKAAYEKWCEKGVGWDVVKAYFCNMAASPASDVASGINPTLMVVLAALKSVCGVSSTSPIPSLPSLPSIPGLPGGGGSPPALPGGGIPALPSGGKDSLVDNSSVILDALKKADLVPLMTELFKIPGLAAFIGSMMPPVASNPQTNFLAWVLPQVLAMPGTAENTLRNMGFGDKAPEIWKQITGEGPMGPASFAADVAKALVGYA